MREGTDFLKGNFITMSVFITFACPFIMNLFLRFQVHDIEKLFIGYEWLTADQKDVVSANFIFSLLQTTFCAWYFFNPCAREKYPSCQKFSAISSLISLILFAAVIPIVQFIYNGVMWDKAKMKDSNIEV